MFSKLYMKMAVYFSGIIATTLVAVALLFFFSMGRPLARDIHTMLRNHTRYLGMLVRDSAGPSRDMDAVARSVHQFSRSYGFHIAVFDENRNPLMESPGFTGQKIALAPEMFQRMENQGIFVQRGHFGRPLIYLFSQELQDGTRLSIVLARQFSVSRPLMPFLGGLAVLGVLLMAAVYPLSRNITRPLTGLSESLERISRGEFEDTPDDGGRSDEIGEVLRVFNRMSQSVDRMIQSKKQLLADISHELCSPLARIRVGTELIRDMGPDEKTRRYLHHIENDIESMDHLILNLSVYSRLNLPGFSLVVSLFPPENLVSHGVFQYRLSAEKKGIILTWDVPGNLPEISGDFGQLKQVVSNLLDNALRYSVKGGQVSAGVFAEGESLAFFVEDSGPGVPEPFREKIFEPLFRVDASRNQDSGGSGLGLAIARRIVELHGGSIECSGQPGKNRFTFRLPVDRRL